MTGALKTASADAFVVIAPFLGPRTRERLADEGVGYVDLAGNMRLVLDRPTVFIASRGDERSPWAAPRDSRSLHAAKASRLVRALCDGAPPLACGRWRPPVGTDPGYVSRLYDLVPPRGAVRAAPRGPVVAVHVARLCAAGPRTIASRRAPVRPRRPPARRAGGVGRAARRAAFRTRSRRARARPRCWARRCPASPSPTSTTPSGSRRRSAPNPPTPAANLLLVDPFDRFVFEGAWEASGLRYAARAQIIADLLDSPPPAASQAAMLLGDTT